MNNRNFQKATNLVFTFALAFGLLLPGSTTLALPQKADDITIQGITTPNDTLYSSQWNLSDWNDSGFWGINAPAAWNITNGSGVVVAVIDSGLAPNVDLDTNRILAGYDFITHTATAAGDFFDPGDNGPCGNSTWHGTHIAGIIGAKSNNGADVGGGGIAGINWNANILPVRVSGTCGAVTAADLMDGMSWAAGLSVTGVTTTNPNPAKVINVSVGVPGQACTTAYQTAISTIITTTGAVIVAAAGDAGSSTSIDFPANCDIPGVITVAATDKLGSHASFSNYNSASPSAVEISAPGGGNTQGDVISTTNSGTSSPERPVDAAHSLYPPMQGTGIAAAHVSGVVSLMLSANPAMTPSQIGETLKQTAQAFPSSVGIPCTTLTCGSGIADARAALKPNLVITKVEIGELPPPSPGIPNPECLASTTPNYKPLPNVAFCVNITVKNQGGSNSGSISYRNVYIDRDPSLLPRDVPPEDSCIIFPNGAPDQGDYFRQDLNASIPAGAEATRGVKITNGLVGVHTIYAYTDAQCIVGEVFENNNAFAPIAVTISQFVNAGMWTTAFNYNEGWRVDMHPRLVGDVNGDGKDDLVGFGYQGVFVALANSTGTGFLPAGMLSTAFNYNEGWRVDMHPRMLGDVNGDGKDDLIGFGYQGVFVALANSTGTGFLSPSLWTTAFNYNDGWRVNMHPRMLGDVNGDGKDDLVGFGDTGVFVALANSAGNGFKPLSMWSTAFNYNEGWRVDMHPRMLGDVNGDGKDDLIGFGYAGVFIALAKTTGDGFETPSMWTPSFNYNEGWRVDMHPRTVADVNGDGKDDLIGFGYAGVFIALANSTGTGFLPAGMWTTAFNYNEGWRVDMHPRMLGDVNGDNKNDLIGFGYAGVFIAVAK